MSQHLLLAAIPWETGCLPSACAPIHLILPWFIQELELNEKQISL